MRILRLLNDTFISKAVRLLLLCRFQLFPRPLSLQLTMPYTWLITGCSSGFGEQFVRQLTAQGDQVIATGRNAEIRLAHLKDTGATILDLDVTISQSEMDMKFQQALKAYGTIDVIVHNAGFIQCGALEELTCVDPSRTLE